MNLNGQSAIVTGGASGLGKACVEILRTRGVRVAVWDIHCETSDVIFCDVREAQSVEDAFKATLNLVGSPRICIHCAGIAPAQRMIGREGAMPLEVFQDVIDINLIGTFNVMRVAAYGMTQLDVLEHADERGVIINTASIAAYEGQIGQMAYSASKGGVIAMTLPAARELAQFGIRVNTIAPGLMETPLLLNMPEQVQANLASTVPFPKRFGKPKEFADLAIHIIENSMLNGEVIRLDGALRMQAK